MDIYSILRQFADSWMLLALFLFFVGVVLWVFRPGARKTYEDTANIPLRNEDRPARDVKTDTSEPAFAGKDL
ncbi:cbb3-type cytochrome c oxidase subunit 3 [Pseudooceanicola marinus]|uniref:cbb3-type cytochrome c oxidase subunit 3 n=1 Tax=Pseudooceanicola marinus TaxID=396013 RepID=UPI001CD34BDF|nr:cbb3-type cytochrome c oxidase subunit 3 [Pseudooceanicola marinus]MCA1337688.1 cbb3-type cytochrome c oxidase subunit 3 [Pseudooceanicola marinus]